MKRKQFLKKKTLRLADNHTWQAPAGYKIVVIDRGLVSFNIPDSWFVAKMEPLELYDHEPPKDDARITVSCWRLPPDVDWSQLPLIGLLSEATQDVSHEILERGEVIKSPRQDIELVWTEHRFLDPQEKREAYSRIALGRGWNAQGLITFDFWVDDLAKSTPIWDEVLRSLQLGRTIDDPTKGLTMH